MHTKVISILVISLSLTSIRCEDWCYLIKPNGNYKGLGMYHHFQLKGNGTGSLNMYNRAGSEWKFQIDYSDDSISLKMIENSVKESDNKNIIHRYGFHLEQRSLESATIDMGGNVFDCTLKTGENDSGIINECVFDEMPNKTYTDKTTQFFPNSVIFKSMTFQDFETLKGAVFHVFDKLNKNKFFVYQPLEKDDIRFQDCSTVSCDELSFVKEMDDYLFAQIDDVIHLESKLKTGKSGHLLLFNIEGRPKYCFIPLIDRYFNTYSSAECKSTEDLIDLFEECFITADPANKVTTERDPIPVEDNKSTVNTHTFSLIAFLLIIFRIFY